MSVMRRLRAALVVTSALAMSPSPAAAPPADAWPLANHFFLPPTAFSADGRYLTVTGSEGPGIDFCPPPACSGWLHVWDLRSGQRLFSTDARMPRVMSVVFSRDSRYLIAGHADGTVVVRSVADFHIVTRFRCCAGTWIRALALSPDERLLAAGAQNGELVLWDFAGEIGTPGPVHPSRSLRGHYYGISSLVFDASGEHLISSADDQHVRRWNLRTGADSEFHRTPELLKAHRGMVKTVVLLNDGRQALTGAYWEGGTYKDYRSVAPPDAILRLWDVDAGTPLRSYPLSFGIRCCIQVLNGRDRVAFLKAGGWDEVPTFQIFNLATGAVEQQVGPTMGESFHTMTMHPDARHFLIGIGAGQYLLWDLAKAAVAAQLVSVQEGWAVVAADGRIDFSGGFTQWACRNNIRQACAGGTPAAPARGLLARLLETP